MRTDVDARYSRSATRWLPLALLVCAIDVALPCADGPNWQVALEADRQGIPVILMTGDPDQAHGLLGGDRPYLLKPFTLASLIDVIDSASRGLPQ